MPLVIIVIFCNFENLCCIYHFPSFYRLSHIKKNSPHPGIYFNTGTLLVVVVFSPEGILRLLRTRTLTYCITLHHGKLMANPVQGININVIIQFVNDYNK